MTKINRRKFIYSSAILAAIPGILSAYEKENEIKNAGEKNKFPAGSNFFCKQS